MFPSKFSCGESILTSVTVSPRKILLLPTSKMLQTTGESKWWVQAPEKHSCSPCLFATMWKTTAVSTKTFGGSLVYPSDQGQACDINAVFVFTWGDLCTASEEQSSLNHLEIDVFFWVYRTYQISPLLVVNFWSMGQTCARRRHRFHSQLALGLHLPSMRVYFAVPNMLHWVKGLLHL